MVSNVYAICDASVAIAEAYGPNVSKGILAMEARILELEREIEKMRGERG